MPWGRVDDNHYDHDKVLRLPRAIRNAADGLYWRAISRCNRALSDGFMSDGDLELLDAEDVLIEALLTVGLWERTRAGRLHIHDYLVFNKSKAEVLQERQKKADAGRAGGIASGRVRAGKAPKEASEKPPAEPRNGRFNQKRSTPEAPASPVVEPPTRPPSFPSGRDGSGTFPPAPPDGGGPVPTLAERGVAPPPGYRPPSIRGRAPVDDVMVETSKAILDDPDSSPAQRRIAEEQLLGLGHLVTS